VESLTEAWLYLGKEPHGLNVEQEASLKVQGFIHPVLFDDWYCDSCEQRHDYRMEDGKTLKACPHNYDDWEPVVESDRQQWWWNLKKIKQTLIETNSLSPRHEKNQVEPIYYVGAYSDQLLCLSAFRTVEQLIKASAFLPQNLQLINLYPLFFNNQQEALLIEKKQFYYSISRIIKKQWFLYETEQEAKNELVLNVKNRTLTILNNTIPLTYHNFVTALILLRSKSGLTDAYFTNEYYKIEQSHSPSASNAVSALNKRIKEHIPYEKRLFSGSKKTKHFSYIGSYSVLIHD
jgi:hypothetical protein